MITIQKEMKTEYLESVDPYSKCLALHVVCVFSVDESEMCVCWLSLMCVAMTTSINARVSVTRSIT